MIIFWSHEVDEYERVANVSSSEFIEGLIKRERYLLGNNEFNLSI